MPIPATFSISFNFITRRSKVNEKTLVICDKEARYAKGLGDYFSERKEFAFKVYACTSAESV